MPSDCQNLGGGTGIFIPFRQKVGGGNCPPCPPPGSRAPVNRDDHFPKSNLKVVRIYGNCRLNMYSYLVISLIQLPIFLIQLLISLIHLVISLIA